MDSNINQKELPSVERLSQATGLHCVTEFLEVSPDLPIGVQMVRLVVAGEVCTPYMPLNEMDCMIVGLMTLSHVINKKLKEAAEILADKNPVESK